MKLASFLMAGVLAAGPALAATQPDGPICVDPKRSYQALYLKDHDIIAKQTIGHDRRQLRLTTSCINLRAALSIALGSSFNCIGLGDDVFTSTIDGERQSCRSTHVEPYVPVAAPHG